MAFGHVVSFGSGSYLSFHDCAAWSFPSGQASSRYGLPVFSSSASPRRRKNAMVLLEPPPYRVPQPSRPGQPAARVGPFQLSSPAPASTRKKVVATASRRKTTASNNLDPLSRARPWSALPRCCVNIAVRVAPTEQASRASLFSWAWGRGCMPWICGHGAPRRGGGGSA